MSDVITVVLYRQPLSNQGCMRPCGPVGVPADTGIPSLFRRLAWDGQDSRSATLGYASFFRYTDNEAS